MRAGLSSFICLTILYELALLNASKESIQRVPNASILLTSALALVAASHLCFPSAYQYLIFQYISCAS